MAGPSKDELAKALAEATAENAELRAALEAAEACIADLRTIVEGGFVLSAPGPVRTRAEAEARRDAKRLQPGEITNPEAYEAALAAGRIAEIPSDT